MKRRIWPGIVAGAVIAADQGTKALAGAIPPDGLPLIPGVVGLRLAENRGIAFSLLSGVPWLTSLLSLGIILGGFWFLRGKKIPNLPMAGLMLMLGGALGNLWDRLLRGYVTDMIELLFVRFAIFNVADACLTVGCGLVMISLLTGWKKDE